MPRRRARAALLVLVLLAPVTALAQATGTLSGRVTDRDTRAPLEAARVEVLGTALAGATDATGRFEITGIPLGVYAVRASAVGHRPVVRTNVVIGAGKPYTLLIELERQPLTLETLTVVEAPFFQPTLQAPSLGQALNAEEIRNAPGVQEDVIRAVSLLPGVGLTSGGRNDLIVRGGAPFENLFLVDGIEVPNLNHFGSQGSTGGPLSLINIDFVQNAEFSSGGFSARYGDRTASVTSVNLREGTREGYAGELNLSATGFGAIVEGPVGPSGSMLLSVRRSYLDLFFKLAGFAFIPTYWDATLKVVQDLGPRDRLSVLTIGALDGISLDQDTPDNRYDNSRIIATEQNQYVAGMIWERSLARGLLEVSLGRTFSAFTSTQVDSLERPILSNRSREGTTALRTSWFRQVGDRHDLRIGQDLRRVGRLQYDILVPGEVRRDDAGIARPLAVDTTLGDWRWAPWVEAGLQVGATVRATLGLRADVYGDLGGATRVSPRVLVAWAVRPGSTLTLAGGVYHQAPSSIWRIGDPANAAGLRPFRATQAIVGFERLLRPDLRFQVEAYHKRYTGYPARAWRESAVLALSGFEDAQSDIPFGLEPLANAGRGTVSGVEFLVQKRFSDIPLYGLASLSLGEARFAGLDGVMRPGSFDTRAILNLTAGYRLGRQWELSGRFRYSTGRPTTPFVTTGPSAGTLDFSQFNQGPRLPAVHALDLRADRRWTLGRVQFQTYLDLQNVYARQNITQFQWDPRTRTALPNESLGLLPSLGVNLEF